MLNVLANANVVGWKDLEDGRLLSFLPDEARQKLSSLRLMREQSYAVVVGATEKRQEFWDRRDELQQQKRLRAATTSVDPENDKEVINQLDRRIEALNAQIDSRNKVIKDTKLPDRVQLVLRLEKYIDRLSSPASIKKFAKAIKPHVEPGETPFDAIERRRHRIDKLQSDLKAVHAAPYPASEAKQRMRGELDALARSGEPKVGQLVDYRGKIEWPTELLYNRERIAVSGVDSRALFAWLFKDQIVSRLDTQIDAVADDASALTDEQRRQKSELLLADILFNEREEENLIERMEAQGAAPMRRPDADPRAVLGLVSELPAPHDD